MIDNFIAGSLALFGDPFSILIFVFGVVGGMLFGAIPGVSMLTLAAILLPFTANFDPAQGVMLLPLSTAPVPMEVQLQRFYSIYQVLQKMPLLHSMDTP